MLPCRVLRLPRSRRALPVALRPKSSVREEVLAAPDVPNFIGGSFVASNAETWIDVHNPATQEVVCRVPQSTDAELRLAVDTAQAAFPSWSQVPIQQRQRVMFKLQALIVENTEELARSITREQGKTLADARGDVFRGLEVVETACNLASTTMGETVSNVGSGLDTQSYRVPLGVAAGICPFNFPAMIPLWMFPVAVTCGNTFVLKPSERTPGAAMLLAQLAQDAGLPDGVLNVAHRTVDHLCTAEAVRAISFVGGDAAGRHIFALGSANNKKVQANLGAKNHVTILPDADREATLNALVGAAFGAAGQRCMALSTAIFVGDSKKWIPELVDKARRLKVGEGTGAGVDLGPMISPAALARAEELIARGAAAGGEVLLDGRRPAVDGFPRGNWLAPTIVHNVSSGNPLYDEEVFGPVLGTLAVDTLDEALAFTNANAYGNGCAIFTASGAAARHFQHAVDVGQVGINVPIPVPLPMFSFTGSRASALGGHYFYGKAGASFYTQIKTVTQNWKYEAAHAAVSGAMPTMK